MAKFVVFSKSITSSLSTAGKQVIDFKEKSAASKEISNWMASGFLKITLAVPGVVVLFLLFAYLLGVSQKYQRMQLYCEVIHLGMTQENVLEEINQHGKFSALEYTRGDTLRLLLTPAQTSTFLKYGRSVELHFKNGTLYSVLAYSLDDAFSLCK